MNFPRYHALCLYFHTALGEYYPIEFPRYHHVVAFNLPLHTCAFSEDQAMSGENVPLDLRVDTEHSGCFQRAFKFHALIEKARKLSAFGIFPFSFGSPLHFNPQTLRCAGLAKVYIKQAKAMPTISPDRDSAYPFGTLS